MPKKDYLGEFEQVVLLAVMRLEESAYGVTIRREIEQQTGRPVTLGAIYPTLHRLEEKGYVSSRNGEPTASRGGRAKRLFAIEPQGMMVLQRSRAMIEALWKGFEPDSGAG